MRFNEKYADSDYIESDGQHSIIQVSDKGNPCQWRGNNKSKKRVIKYRVDGGIITSKFESKCDYAVWVEGDRLYFIELKGSDYSHALEQIDSTLEKLIKDARVDVSSVNGRIVLTRSKVPNIRYSKEMSLNKKLIKLNGTLASKVRIFEEEI